MEHAAETVTILVLQLAIIIIAGRIGGELAQRIFKQPPVLGELVVGVIIGPFALGALSVPLLGPLFPSPPDAGVTIPISSELYAIAQIGAVVLLFASGLETDRKQFMQQGPAAFAVATGGVILPFAFGATATWLLGYGDSIGSPPALFTGAIMTATSVGITARALGELGRLDTPEGVTILGGAVIDDVLGILVLAIVISLALSGNVSAAEVALIGGRALGVWLLLTAVVIVLARPLSRFFDQFKTDGAGLVLALGVGFLAAVVAQSVGLAMIIGAYSAGLALSDTPLAHRLRLPLGAIYQFMAPVFFVVMGMLVNLPAIGLALGFGVVITILAIVGKTIGCAVPALAVGFNRLGAIRVGVGMLPRGEVALIVAGVGLTSGLVTSAVFGVAILMTVVTTLMAPPLLVWAFRDPRPGIRRAPAVSKEVTRYESIVDGALAARFQEHLTQTLLSAGYGATREVRAFEGPQVFDFQRDDDFVSLELESAEDGRTRVVIEAQGADFAQAVVEAATRLALDDAMSFVAPLSARSTEGVSARLEVALAERMASE